MAQVICSSKDIGPDLAKDIPSDINPLTYVNDMKNPIVIFDVSREEFKNIIDSLKNSSAGHDDFPTFVGKLCVDSYIESLTLLINSSLKAGVFPSELKVLEKCTKNLIGHSRLAFNNHESNIDC